MNGQSRIRTSIAIGIAGCFAALALLVPSDPATSSAGDAGDCRSPGWVHILTGPFGTGDCR